MPVATQSPLQWAPHIHTHTVTHTQSHTHTVIHPHGVNHATEQLARPLSRRLTIRPVSLVAGGCVARGDVAYHWPLGTWGWDPRSNRGLFPWTQEGCRGCWTACRAVGERRTDRQTRGGRVKTKDGLRKWIHLNRDWFVSLTPKWLLG